MAEITEAQKQLLDEMNALVKAWMDRGTTYRDVVPLLGTYLVTVAIQGGYKLDMILHMMGRLWASAMVRIVEAAINKSIPEPPINPPSKL
jgi:hypothetical protein